MRHDSTVRIVVLLLGAAGAILAIVGVFLPWISDLPPFDPGHPKSISGTDFVRHGAPQYPYAIIALSTLGIGFLFPGRRPTTVTALSLGVMIVVVAVFAFQNLVPEFDRCSLGGAVTCGGNEELLPKVKPVGIGILVVIVGGSMLAAGTLLDLWASRNVRAPGASHAPLSET